MPASPFQSVTVRVSVSCGPTLGMSRYARQAIVMWRLEPAKEQGPLATRSAGRSRGPSSAARPRPRNVTGRLPVFVTAMSCWTQAGAQCLEQVHGARRTGPTATTIGPNLEGSTDATTRHSSSPERVPAASSADAAAGGDERQYDGEDKNSRHMGSTVRPARMFHRGHRAA